MEQQNQASQVLLFYMSLWTQRQRPQTNEAALMHLKATGSKPEKILALCSEKVRTQTFPDQTAHGEPTLEYYRSCFLKQKGEYPDPDRVLSVIPVPDTMQDADRIQAIRQVAELLPENARLTIDLTGGMRDTAALLVAIARYLESFKKLASCQVLYTELDYGQDGAISCRDVTVLYDIFDLISATDLFLETGSARKIQEFFNHSFLNQNAQRAITAVESFFDNISLCQFDQLDAVAQKIHRVIQKSQNSAKSNAGQQDSLSRLFFEFLAARFQQEYAVFQNREESLPDIVEWCVTRRMYQQALTLLAEDMPAYVCRHTDLQPDKALKIAWLREGKSPRDDSWSYYLFHKVLKGLTTTERILDYLDTQLNCKAPEGPRIQFSKAEIPLLAAAINCYNQVLSIRNFVNHAYSVQEPPALDKMTDALDKTNQVTDLLKNAAEVLRQLRANPASHDSDGSWIPPEYSIKLLEPDRLPNYIV